MNDRVAARGRAAALWAVTTGTVAAALVLAAVDRLLIASAVMGPGAQTPTGRQPAVPTRPFW